MNTITSNYEAIMAGIAAKQQQKSDDFISQLINEKKSQNTNEDPLDFNNIKSISYEEIQTKIAPQFQNEVKNLKLATIFSSDPIMQMTLFNTVKNGSFESNTTLLSNIFTHKNIYLNNQNDSLQRGAMLRKSIIEQIDDPSLKAQQEELEKQFNLTMMQFEMNDYFSAMLDFGKEEKDKNKDSQYGFLFNDFYEQYALLQSDYLKIEDLSKMMLAQYSK